LSAGGSISVAPHTVELHLPPRLRTRGDIAANHACFEARFLGRSLRVRKISRFCSDPTGEGPLSSAFEKSLGIREHFGVEAALLK
jgi:hypothetical protein